MKKSLSKILARMARDGDIETVAGIIEEMIEPEAAAEETAEEVAEAVEEVAEEPAAVVETPEGYLTVPFEYGGYMMKYENGQAEVLPAYDPFSMTRIHAGGVMLTKIPVCGYYEDDMFTAVTEGEAGELFITLKRMTPAKRNLL